MEGLQHSNLGFYWHIQLLPKCWLHILSPRDMLIFDIHFPIQPWEPHYWRVWVAPCFLRGLMLSDFQWLMPKKEFRTIWRVKAKQSKTNKQTNKTITCMHSHLCKKPFFPTLVVIYLASLYRNYVGLSVFNEAPPTLSTRTSKIRSESVPSLSGSDLEFVNERNSQRIWKGRWSGSHSSWEVAVGRCISFLTTSMSSQFSIMVTRCGGSNNLHELWLLSSPWASVLSPQGLLLQSFIGCPSRLLLAISRICGIPNSLTKFLILRML